MRDLWSTRDPSEFIAPPIGVHADMARVRNAFLFLATVGLVGGLALLIAALT